MTRNIEIGDRIKTVLILTIALICAPMVCEAWECRKSIDEMTGAVKGYYISSRAGGMRVHYDVDDKLIGIKPRDSELRGGEMKCSKRNCLYIQKARIRVVDRSLYNVEYISGLLEGAGVVKFSSGDISIDSMTVPSAFLEDLKVGKELWIEATTFKYTNKVYKVPLTGFTTAYKECVAGIKQ